MPDLERVSRLQAHSRTDVPLRAHGLTSPGLISFSPLLRKQLTPSSESLPTNDHLESAMPNQNDIRQAITNQIISALESGSVPSWRRPWRLGKNAGAAANVVSKRSYRGLNPILLSLHAENHQLTSKWYGTFNQWRQLDGRVMRRPPHVPEGQWGCQICFWTPVTKTVQTDEGDEQEDRFFVLRMYTVFCVDQVEGKHLDHLRAGQSDTNEPLTVDYQPAEDAIGATGANIRYGGGKAFYSPSNDSSRCRQKPLSRAWTNSMAHVSTSCAIGVSPGCTGPARTLRTPTPLANSSPRSVPASCAGNWASRQATISKTTSPTSGTGSRRCATIPVLSLSPAHKPVRAPTS